MNKRNMLIMLWVIIVLIVIGILVKMYYDNTDDLHNTSNDTTSMVINVMNDLPKPVTDEMKNCTYTQVSLSLPTKGDLYERHVSLDYHDLNHCMLIIQYKNDK